MFGTPQSPGKPGDMISLCVGGRLFVTRRATLYRLPDSRLYLIATQGSSCQNATNFSSSATSEVYSPTPIAHPFSNSYGGISGLNTSERAVIAGATVLPANLASMIAGNMNLKSASALVRNRGSLAQNAFTPQILSPGFNDSSFPVNLSVPVTTQQGPTLSFAPTSPVVYFYDRDPEIFRFVLDYYRTGELHLPSSICGPFVRKELIFWGIDESYIGPCCMPAYMRYDEEKRTKNTLFRDCFEDIDSMKNLVKYSRGWKKWRYRMWLFMDHPSSSLPAKIWASCLLVLMIASVMCYCLSTQEFFRMPSSVTGTTRERGYPHIAYLHTSVMTSNAEKRRVSEHSPLYMSNSHSTTQTHLPLDEANQTKILTNESVSLQLNDICDTAMSDSNPKMNRDCTTEPTSGLVLADIALNCLFTAEFMLKVLLAPDKQKFLSSIVSIIDVIILSSYWVYMALFYYYYYHPKLLISNDVELRNELSGYLWLLNILSMTQAMRILRIFKISKISRILRVLILTVKKSIPELVLLGFLLMNGMFMFSSLIYMAEYRVNDTFPDIPHAFWWSIITLTSVGYGDVHPKGGAGYFVGSITAICGCIVTGLAIPIIGNNFNTYYKYMKNQLMEDKYLKVLRKDMESTAHSGGKSGIAAAADKSGLSLPGRKLRQMNRSAVRGRVAHRGLRQKLDRMFYLNTLSLRRHIKSKTSAFRSDEFANQSDMKSSGSLQVLTDNQQVPLINATRKSLIDATIPEEKILSKEFAQTILFASTGTVRSSIEMEHRTSMTHPLATDNQLSELATSRLSILNAPRGWVDGAEEVATLEPLLKEDMTNLELRKSDGIGFLNGTDTLPSKPKDQILSPRNSYQEINFIPPIRHLDHSDQLHKTFKLHNWLNVTIPSTELEIPEAVKNSHTEAENMVVSDQLAEKRKNYV